MIGLNTWPRKKKNFSELPETTAVCSDHMHEIAAPLPVWADAAIVVKTRSNHNSNELSSLGSKADLLQPNFLSSTSIALLLGETRAIWFHERFTFTSLRQFLWGFELRETPDVTTKMSDENILTLFILHSLINPFNILCERFIIL